MAADIPNSVLAHNYFQILISCSDTICQEVAPAYTSFVQYITSRKRV